MTDAPPADEAPLPRLGLREPLGSVIDDEDSLARAVAELSVAYGPVALDAERASGYRYSQRAYLVQIRREGAGTFLIDPTAFDALTWLDEAFNGVEWILHAATQDLPCLAEIGLRPTALFDTELAGRLLNLPRVGLAGLVEHYLKMSLAKEFSAADWSTRPLPEPWLEYAALDVEVLVELRTLIEADLERAGKTEWAQQEFESLLSFTGPPERGEPWRRTSGIHRARKRRALAVVRSLWYARDRIAAEQDVTVGRILSDSAIMDLALSPPSDRGDMRARRSTQSRRPRRFLDTWQQAIDEALSLPDDELPTTGGAGLPPPRAWAEKRPEAAARLQQAKAVVTEIAERCNLPAENLVTPALVRQLAWEPPVPITADTVAEWLTEAGARRWQVELVAAPISAAMAA